MNIRQNLLIGATIMLLATGNAFAANNNGNGNSCNSEGVASLSPACFQAPEIDAASGTSAIALLTGVLLLLGERIRTRRS